MKSLSLILLTILLNICAMAQVVSPGLPIVGKMRKLGVDSLNSATAVKPLVINDSLYLTSFLQPDSIPIPVTGSKNRFFSRGLLGMFVKYADGSVRRLDSAGTFAPTSATFITQTPDGTLSGEQALSLLSTGFMKSATTTGAVTTQAQIGLTADVSGVLPIANGGTNGGTALAGFNNLSPLTTRGDLLIRDASNNVRLAIGTTGKFLKTDGTDPSWQSIAESDVTNLASDLALKAPLASPTFTGTVTVPSPFTLGSTSVTATGTEHNYLVGVTSAIQTQLNARALSATTVTIAGTTNQIISSAGAQDLSASRVWTLSLPQNIHTGASPTFAGLTLSGLADTRVAYSASGVITGDANMTYVSQRLNLGKGLNLINSQYGFPNLTLVDTVNGQDQYMFNSAKPSGWFLAQGTNASPDSIAGPIFKIVKTQWIRTLDALPNRNNNDDENLAAVLIEETNTPTDSASMYGLSVHVQGVSTVGTGGGITSDIDAANFIARAMNGHAGVATGAYAEGRNDSATVKAAIGLEVRTADYGYRTRLALTGSATTADSNTGIWLTANGRSGRSVGSAIAIANPFGIHWKYGFVARPTAIDSTTILDNSSAATSIQVNGTHSVAAIATGQNAGDIGFGYLTPPIVASSGRQFLTMVGNTDGGVLEFGTRGSDADGRLVGLIQASDINSTLANKRRAAIEFDLNGSTGNARGGRIKFHTSKDNVSGLNVVGSVDSLGWWTFANNANPTVPFSVAGTHNSATLIQFNPVTTSSNTSQLTGINYAPTFNPSGASLSTVIGDVINPAVNSSSLTIGSYYGLSVRPDLGAGFSGVITSLRQIIINNPTVSGGSITTQTGLYIADLTSGSTNYGLYGGVTSGSNKWNLYIPGSAQNGITGKTMFGSTVVPTNLISLDGQAAQTVWMERHATSNTVGNNLTLQAGGATSAATDKNGGALILSPGASTGTGRNNVNIKGYTTATATGTSDNAQIDRAIFNCFKALTNNSATSLVNCTIANSTTIGGTLDYTVEVTDGTNYQVETGQVAYMEIDKATVKSNNTALKYGNQQATTSGTLTCTFTITAANPAVIQVNANSSLTPSAGYPRVTYSIHNKTQQAIAIQ